MNKIKINLIATWISNHKNFTKVRGRLFSFPTLINLAGLTPGEDVSVQYEHIRPINYDVDADLIGISFITPFADYTFSVADEFRKRKIKVVLGGPYVTVFPERCAEHADAIVIGDAEDSWPDLVNDFKNGCLKKTYKEIDYRQEGTDCELKLPVPRFDLIKKDMIFTQTVTATRGCPNFCDFCFLKSYKKDFRTRTVDDVIRDLHAHKGNWLQNKLVGFWDDNLIGDVEYAKKLFKRLKPLKKWWVAQVTIDFAYDDELLKLAAESGCVGVYIGFESFNQESLKEVHKFKNKVEDYRAVVKKLHSYGILVASGLIVGFDHDTNAVFDNSVKTMHKIGIDWVNANILVPFEGTPIFDKLKKENRILTNDSYYYNGSAVTFNPKNMTAKELNDGFLKMVKDIYSLKYIFKRLTRFFIDVPKNKFGTYFIFFATNIVYFFLKRSERILSLGFNHEFKPAKMYKDMKIFLKKKPVWKIANIILILLVVIIFSNLI
jgi:radical SAM superfamily enzyme YgiQ (UPF0313 family)